MPDRDTPDPVSRLLIEKRCEVYTQVAALLMDMQEAHDEDDGLRARYLVLDVRRALRTALAFLTDEVYQELERLEALLELLPTREGAGLPAAAAAELGDRVQLLHVKLARSLKLPRLQDLDEIVGLEPRLVRRLEDESKGLEAKQRRRELEAQCLRHEAEAREEIGRKAYARAAKALRAAIAVDPDRAVLHNDLGVVLSLTGKTDEAVQEYEQAVALNERLADRRTPEWTTSWFNLGAALRKQGLELLDRGLTGPGVEALGRAREALDEYTRLGASGTKLLEARGLVASLGEQLQAFDRVRPPGDDRRPPGDDRRPPGDDRRPPGDDRRPPGDDRRPPGDDRRPPGDDRRPPGDDRRPPGDRELSPGDRGRASGDLTRAATPTLEA